MPVDPKLRLAAFRKLNRQLTKLAAKPAASNVHRFRTLGRRVEALLEELLPHLTRGDKKLLKLLGRLRKKAGRVRDLDVQITSLRNLMIMRQPLQKTQFIRALAAKRERREKKLVEAFSADTLKELRKRLKRAAIRMGASATADPLALAKEQLARLGRQHSPLTEKTLHQYRVTGKRARYLAEVADQDADAKYMIEQLTHMQDVLGDWHDWLKLTRSAEKLLGSEHASALVAALRNITQAKFRHSIIILSETRAALAGSAPRPIDTAPRRRNPASADSGYAAVA